MDKTHKKEENNYWWIVFGLILLFWFFSSGDEPQTENTTLQEGAVYVTEPNENENELIERSLSSTEPEELIDYEEGKFSREFDWGYQDYDYGVTLTLYPKVYEVYKERERIREYDLFASDSYSKPFIKSLTESLEEYGLDNGLSRDEIPYFIISFVFFVTAALSTFEKSPLSTKAR